jgi:hypothetical protein
VKPWRLAILLLVCLVPRAWVAWQQDTICPDAVPYLQSAEDFQQGKYSESFDYLSLNIYPAVMLLLRRTGVNWLLACEAWSVLMSTLAVLPLYGLVRRQLDERTAIVAGLLYAMHPRLILYSPLILRDPTFWFLFLLSLYLAWRAATELRWWLLAAGGAAFLLTIHTRSEGWLLVFPLAIWTVGRLWTAPGWKRRLLWGIPICIAVVPAVTVLVNVTLLRHESKWEVAGMRHFQYAWQWLRTGEGIGGGLSQFSFDENGTVPLGSAQDRAALPGAQGWPAAKVSEKLLVRFVKSFTYIYGLLILAGLWALRRRLWRSDLLPYFLIAGTMFAGIWIRYNLLPIDERYFFTILLVALPGSAAGMLQIADWIARLAARLRPTPDLRPAAVLALLAVVAVGGAIDGIHAGRFMFRAWREQADLGRWILDRQGPQKGVAGNSSEMRLLAHYARGYLVFDERFRYTPVPPTPANPMWLPQVLVVWEGQNRSEARALCEELLDRQTELGYQRVPADVLPPSCQAMAVLVKTQR